MTGVTTSGIAVNAADPRTTAVSPTAVHTTAQPGRQAKTSALRRTSQVVLVGGTVLAVAAAFGPAWLVRIGVGVAVAAAILACVFAWREMSSARRQHAKDTLRASQQHGHALREERTRNGEVVDTLTRRMTEAGKVISGQQVVIGTLRTEVSGLRGDQVHLKSEIAQRDTVIGSLRDTVRSRDAELAALRDAEWGGEEASISHMPRRVLAEHESTWTEVPGADELWTDGSHPTVVDLQMLDTAMVLPNYEVDRRVG